MGYAISSRNDPANRSCQSSLSSIGSSPSTSRRISLNDLDGSFLILARSSSKYFFAVTVGAPSKALEATNPYPPEASSISIKSISSSFFIRSFTKPTFNLLRRPSKRMVFSLILARFWSDRRSSNLMSNAVSSAVRFISAPAVACDDIHIGDSRFNVNHKS